MTDERASEYATEVAIPRLGDRLLVDKKCP